MKLTRSTRVTKKLGLQAVFGGTTFRYYRSMFDVWKGSPRIILLFASEVDGRVKPDSTVELFLDGESWMTVEWDHVIEVSGDSEGTAYLNLPIGFTEVHAREPVVGVTLR